LHFAENDVEAWDMLDGNHVPVPKILLIDINGWINGLDLINKIRSHEI
jgi:hypothetical protein